MTTTLYTPASLTDDQLAQIRAFEQQTGRILLAFEQREQPVAALSAAEQARLRALEQELGVVMVACQG